MRFVSLFSGIGGMDLGLERAGMECVGQVENDPWCNQILEKHWPDTPRWQDIHDLDPKELPDHDLIAGGFPCQPVSLAGARLAQDDPRWLWPEFFRIVRMVRPRYVVVENVPGLASAGMGVILGDLAQVGYDTEWQSVPAAFVGAPHLRWRIFIVAYPAGSVGSYFSQGIGRESAMVGAGVSASRGTTGGDTTSRVPRRERIELDGATDVADAEDTDRRGTNGTQDAWWWNQETGRRGLGRSGLQHWAAEPDVGRVADGVPRRVDRLRGLGNAVVPQVAELVGRMIMETSR